MRRILLAAAASAALALGAATPAIASPASTGKAVTSPITGCEEISTGNPDVPDETLTVCHSGTITFHEVSTPSGVEVYKATAKVTNTTTYAGITTTDHETDTFQYVRRNGTEILFRTDYVDIVDLPDGTTCTVTLFGVYTNGTTRLERSGGDCPAI